MRVGVALLLRELEQHAQVVEAALQVGEPVEVALEQREPAGDPGGVGLVVPQVGGGHLLAEVGDLARIASRSSTCSMVCIVAWSCLIWVSKSGPATTVPPYATRRREHACAGRAPGTRRGT